MGAILPPPRTQSPSELGSLTWGRPSGSLGVWGGAGTLLGPGRNSYAHPCSDSIARSEPGRKRLSDLSQMPPSSWVSPFLIQGILVAQLGWH